MTPYSEDAEKGVLGCLLIADDRRRAEIIEQCEECYFHLPAHKVLYLAVRAMWDKRKGIDLITLTDELADKGMLEDAGGAAGITEIMTGVPSVLNAEHYLDTLRRMHKLRETYFSAVTIAENIKERQEYDVAFESLLRAQQSMDKVRAKSWRDVCLGVLPEYEDGKDAEYTTGFIDLDRLTGGLGRRYWIVSAPTGGGKSAIASCIMEHFLESGQHVAMFSYEMTAKMIIDRIMSWRCRIPLHALQSCRMKSADSLRAHGITSDQMRKFTVEFSRIAEYNLHFNDSRPGIEEMKKNVAYLHHCHSLSLIVVDYVQIIPHKSEKSRQQALAELSSELLGLSRKYEIPVIALSQQNDDGRTREARDMENDADVICQIKYDEDERTEARSNYRIHVSKQRQGARGVLPIEFFGEYARFANKSNRGEQNH